MIKVNTFIIVVFFSAASVANNIYPHRPFKDNLRIMSFSNIMGKVYPSYYIPETDLYSKDGINANNIIGANKISQDYAESNHGDGVYGGMISLHKLIELKRREVFHKNNLLFDIGGSLVPPLNSDKRLIKDITSMHIDMSVDAMTIGSELMIGKVHVENIASEYASTNVSILSTNIKDSGEFLFNPYKEFFRLGHKIVVIGVSSIYENNNKGTSGFSSKSNLTNLTRMVDYFKDDNFLVIILSANTIEYNTSMAEEVPGINIILGGTDKIPLPHPLYVKNDLGVVILINAGGDGNHLSIMDLDLSTKDINNFRYSLIPVNSDFIDQTIYDYTLHNSVRDAKPANIIKTNIDLATGNFFPKSFDLQIMSALKSSTGADIIIGSPSLTNVSVKAGSYITKDHLNRYFFNTNHRLVETHITGNEIHSLLNNYFNKTLFLKPHYRLIRTMGISYTIDKINDRFSITIQSINGNVFKRDKKYKLSGWGDITKEDTSNEFIEIYLSRVFEDFKIKDIKFKDIIILNN